MTETRMKTVKAKKAGSCQFILCWLLSLVVPLAAGSEVEDMMRQVIAEPHNQQVEMVRVSFAPNESSVPHRHNAHVFVYMLEGEIEMQLEGGEKLRLKPGETFYEAPDDVHVVTRNTSGKEPAVFLVFFVQEAGKSNFVPIE